MRVNRCKSVAVVCTVIPLSLLLLLEDPRDLPQVSLCLAFALSQQLGAQGLLEREVEARVVWLCKVTPVVLHGVESPEVAHHGPVVSEH